MFKSDNGGVQERAFVGGTTAKMKGVPPRRLSKTRWQQLKWSHGSVCCGASAQLSPSTEQWRASIKRKQQAVFRQREMLDSSGVFATATNGLVPIEK